MERVRARCGRGGHACCTGRARYEVKVTLEDKTMMESRVSEVLDDLIEVRREEESCYKACAQLLQKDPLRRSLKRRAQQAARARRHLTKLRDAMGSTTCQGPALSRMATMQTTARAFGAVSDEASARGMCERLEAIALMRYRDALDFELPDPVRKLLQRQFDALLARHKKEGATGKERDGESAKAPTIALA